MAIAGLAVFVVARLVARTISRPIREAAQVAERVAAGDLTAKVEVGASGEAGKLLRADRDDDRRPPVADRPDPAVEHHADVHRDRDRRHLPAAGAGRQRLRRLDQRGRRRRQGDLGHQPGTAQDDERGQRGRQPHRAAWPATGRGASPRWTGRCGSSPTRPTRSAPSSRSSASAPRNINLVVTTITKVADQTNLLSINAAIEAEKAGEYGLGFLVVAREIRRLADQTAVATLDIERMVKEMQYSVSAGVMEMDKFSEQVRRGVGEVGPIGDQLGQIIAAVQGLTGRFDQVTEGMRVQSQGAEQIREAVIRLSEGASQTSISLREFNKATDHLREAVGGLKEEVSRFTLGDRPLVRPVAASGSLVGNAAASWTRQGEPCYGPARRMPMLVLTFRVAEVLYAVEVSGWSRSCRGWPCARCRTLRTIWPGCSGIEAGWSRWSTSGSCWAIGLAAIGSTRGSSWSTSRAPRRRRAWLPGPDRRAGQRRPGRRRVETGGRRAGDRRGRLTSGSVVETDEGLLQLVEPSKILVGTAIAASADGGQRPMSTSVKPSGIVERLLAERIGLDPSSVGEGLIARGVHARMTALGLRDRGPTTSGPCSIEATSPGAGRGGGGPGELVLPRRAAVPGARPLRPRRAG